MQCDIQVLSFKCFSKYGETNYKETSSMLLLIEEETFTLLVSVCDGLCVDKPLRAHVMFLGSWTLM